MRRFVLLSNRLLIVGGALVLNASLNLLVGHNAIILLVMLTVRILIIREEHDVGIISVSAPEKVHLMKPSILVYALVWNRSGFWIQIMVIVITEYAVLELRHENTTARRA